jgi:hypothetical protein
VDASLADASCLVIARDAEVDRQWLTWADAANDITPGAADLAAVGIILR